MRSSKKRQIAIALGAVVAEVAVNAPVALAYNTSSIVHSIANSTADYVVIRPAYLSPDVNSCLILGHAVTQYPYQLEQGIYNCGSNAGVDACSGGENQFVEATFDSVTYYCYVFAAAYNDNSYTMQLQRNGKGPTFEWDAKFGSSLYGNQSGFNQTTGFGVWGEQNNYTPCDSSWKASGTLNLWQYYTGGWNTHSNAGTSLGCWNLSYSSGNVSVSH